MTRKTQSQIGTGLIYEFGGMSSQSSPLVEFSSITDAKCRACRLMANPIGLIMRGDGDGTINIKSIVESERKEEEEKKKNLIK